ncbi:hypothetical protein J437_LFUL007386 [Ladona fulva]|uniref:Peptidase M14 domain-containing protein n=1 Tax=Ladona fulva TaxID=123851 RepID=A0A8K0P0C0_LADFU|nr:hypothetical protein J437_LFUL007386 [Ladona fulva]
MDISGGLSWKSAQVYNLTSAFPGIDWWSTPTRHDLEGDLMVSPPMRKVFESILNAKSLSYEVLSDNVQALFDAEVRRQRLAQKRSRPNERISFERYYDYDGICAYLDEIAAKHPNIVTQIVAGKSYEGRVVRGVKVSSGPGKRMVMVDAGIHAREWIAPAVALYLLQQLTEGTATDLVNDVDWLILPVVNPDGYQFTFTENRNWKKTRSVFSPTEYCKGVDANRNFDFHWMESGSSQMPCDSAFAGKSAFSEPESNNIKSVILQNVNEIDAYITLHSYGQYIFYPWEYSSELPDDWQELDHLAKEMRAAIASVHGTSYLVGTSGAILFPASGTSSDWAKAVPKIKYTYTIKLPGGGGTGFDLPPERIPNVVQETLMGLKVVGQHVSGKHKK